MANTTTPTALELQKWRRNFWREYVRESGFKSFMSNSPTAVIHTMMELTSGGKTITIPLVGRLSGGGVTGSSTLAGNEEALGQYGHDITVSYRRNAVAIDKQNLQYSAADQLAVVRPLLKEWSMDKLRTDIINAMQTIDGVAYGTATEAQKDAWLDNNLDRVIFGSAVGNVDQTAPAGGATNDHSGSLGNIDNTADKLTASLGQLVKRRAKSADPHIRPFRVGDEGREYFIMFCNKYAFRDLKSDMETKNLDGRPRNVGSNPVFQDGDLIDDGVIYREIPEIGVLSGVGAGSIDVAPNFLCGAQAIGVAYGQMPKPTVKKEDDYGFVKGRGIEECLGVSKTQRDQGSGDQIDHGVHTVYTAGVADA